jgi:hypothetical protein
MIDGSRAPASLSLLPSREKVAAKRSDEGAPRSGNEAETAYAEVRGEVHPLIRPSGTFSREGRRGLRGEASRHPVGRMVFERSPLPTAVTLGVAGRLI